MNTEENEVYSSLSLYIGLSMLLPETSEITLDELLEGLSTLFREEFEEMVQFLLKKKNIFDNDEYYTSLLVNE